jgi:STIP1 family protein 1
LFSSNNDDDFSANNLALCQKLSYGDEITSQLRFAKREKFRLEEEKRITQEIELQTYLNGLIAEHAQRKIDALGEESANSGEVDAIRQLAQKYTDQLNGIFSQVCFEIVSNVEAI